MIGRLFADIDSGFPIPLLDGVEEIPGVSHDGCSSPENPHGIIQQLDRLQLVQPGEFVQDRDLDGVPCRILEETAGDVLQGTGDPARGVDDPVHSRLDLPRGGYGIPVASLECVQTGLERGDAAENARHVLLDGATGLEHRLPESAFGERFQDIRLLPA